MLEPIIAISHHKGTMVCGNVRLVPNVPTRVGIDFIKEYGQDPHVEFDFREMEENLATYSTDGRVLIDWRSPLSMVDGYGRHAIAIIRGLQEIGCEVMVRDVGWLDNAFMPADVKAMKQDGKFLLPAKIGVSMTVPYDPQLYNHNSPIKIAVTQFETNHVPAKHVANINRCDHLIVTSSFGKPLFERSGVRIPIDVMTPGVDDRFFYEHHRAPDGTFRVLILGALTGRKNPEAAIRIFQAASRGNEDWRLTIKTRKAVGIQRVQALAKGDTRIQCVVSDDPPEAVLGYYHQHDCLLWPSKGEGVGLPPLEAMSTGMEVVMSDNSGMHDFVGKHCYVIRNSGMEDAQSETGGFSREYVNQFGEVGEWWVPDEDDAAKQLEKCFHNWLDGKGRGSAAARYVRENHTLADQGRSVLRVVEEYL